MGRINFSMRFLPAIIFIALMTFSCNQENKISPGPGSDLQTNQEEYKKLIQARIDYDGAVFEIAEIKRTDDVISIIIEGKGNADDYKIVWSGIFLESFPMITGLVVAYEGESQSGASGRHTLTVDLKKLFGEHVNPDHVTVNVSNGSKPVDNAVDPNGVVTKSN